MRTSLQPEIAKTGVRTGLAMTKRVAYYVIAMKPSVGWGHVPTGAGTTKYVQTCSCLLSAASRSAGGRLRAPPAAEEASKKEWQNQGD